MGIRCLRSSGYLLSPRFNSSLPLPLSLASQLPQVVLVCTKYVFAENPCGSWLASDGVSSGNLTRGIRYPTHPKPIPPDETSHSPPVSRSKSRSA